MTSISANELRKQILEMAGRTGLPASLFDELQNYGNYSSTAIYSNAVPTYSPPEPKKIYLGMYVYVEKWPEVPVYEKSRYRVCINVDCDLYLCEPTRQAFAPSFLGELCSSCNNPRKHYGVEVKRTANIDTLINNILGRKCFTDIWDKEVKASEIPNKRVIVPTHEYTFELGGTIIEDNLTSLKGVIDALKRSEKVHEYWYVLCASLQRHEAKFQTGRGLVII